VLIIVDKDKCGVNPFYPLFAGRKGKLVSIVEWENYRRMLPLFAFISLSLCAAGLLLMRQDIYSDTRFDLYAMANLIFTYFRLTRFKKPTKIKISQSTTFRKTPLFVDIEFITSFLSLSLACVIALDGNKTDYAFLIVILGLICFLFALVPIFNGFHKSTLF
jgi:hypothetical protein